MNTKYNRFFLEKNYTVDDDVATSVIDDYDVCVRVIMRDVYPLNIHIAFFASDEQKQKIANCINDLELRYFSFSFLPTGLVIQLGGYTVKGMLNNYEGILFAIVKIIKDNGALNNKYCPICGNEYHNETNNLIIYESFKVKVDSNCASNLVKEFGEYQTAKNNLPNNYHKGIIGACIGSIIGSVIYAIVFTLGYSSSLVAIITVLLAQHFYKKLNGKEDNKMIAICAITSLSFTLITYFGLYVRYATNYLIETGLSLKGITAFVEMMKVNEFAISFSYNLAFTIIFTLIGLAWGVLSMKKQIKINDEIKVRIEK
jgi:hypothetical protein